MQRLVVLLLWLGAVSASAAPSKAKVAALDGVAHGPDGAPLANVTVAAVPVGFKSPPPAATTLTGPDGHFAFKALPVGTYGVTATSSQYASTYQGDVKVGDAPATVNLSLGRDGIKLEGDITSDDGAALSDLKVVVARISEVEGDEFHVAVKDGHFSAVMGKGFEYSVTVLAAGRDPETRQLADGAPTEARWVLSLPLAGQPAAPKEVVAWMKAHASPLAGVAPTASVADLEPLRALVGSARVVTLGEATHGTAEFFQLKQRVFQFLVEKMGFTTLGLEMGWAETLPINEYVLTGKGEVSTLLAHNRFWTWNTEEVLTLVKWMRAYNADPGHARKLEFLGFDMQFSPEALAVVLDYLKQVDPALLAQVRGPLRPLADEWEAAHLGPAKAQLQAMADALVALDKALVANEKAYVSKGTARAWSHARHAVRIAQQTLRREQADAPHDHRDASMAENLRWLLEDGGPGTKVMGWAQNLHVARWSEPGWANMGAHLAKDLGADAVTIGFMFNRGSYEALATLDDVMMSMDHKLGVWTLPKAPVGTIDQTLARVGLPLFFLPLRDADADPATKAWLHRKHGARDLGAVQAEQPLMAEVLPEFWDGVIFVDEMHAAKPLATGVRSGPMALQDKPHDLDFERSGAPWQLAVDSKWSGYQVAFADRDCHGGAHCLDLRRDDAPAPRGGYGLVRQRIDARAFAGKRVRLHGWLKVASAEGRAMLWLNAGKNFADAREIDSRDVAPAPGAWTEVTVELEVPAQATQLNIGLVLDGPGHAWFDDLSLAVVPVPK